MITEKMLKQKIMSRVYKLIFPPHLIQISCGSGEQTRSHTWTSGRRTKSNWRWQIHKSSWRLPFSILSGKQLGNWSPDLQGSNSPNFIQLDNNSVKDISTSSSILLGYKIHRKKRKKRKILITHLTRTGCPEPLLKRKKIVYTMNWI